MQGLVRWALAVAFGGLGILLVVDPTAIFTEDAATMARVVGIVLMVPGLLALRGVGGPTDWAVGIVPIPLYLAWALARVGWEPFLTGCMIASMALEVMLILSPTLDRIRLRRRLSSFGRGL